jgi:hypothetical protein
MKGPQAGRSARSAAVTHDRVLVCRPSRSADIAFRATVTL